MIYGLGYLVVGCSVGKRNTYQVLFLHSFVFFRGLLLAPFCDSAPSRESVKRACVSALLRVDGSLFYNV